METVCHVDVTEVEEVLGFLYLLEWVGYSVSGAFDVLVYFAVVATQSNVWACSLGGNDQG